jgi:hypothetical protein
LRYSKDEKKEKKENGRGKWYESRSTEKVKFGKMGDVSHDNKKLHR